MKAKLASGELLLHGPVGLDFWDDDGLQAADVRDLVSGRSGDLTVRINSGGGDPMEGAAIHAVLSGLPGRVIMIVEGVAASAASLIAMAGDEIVMAEGALMMIHDPSAFTRGTAEDHQRQADALNAIADTYAGVYARRAGITAEEAREIMRAEVWMGPEAAVERGFADRVEAREREVRAAAMAFPYQLYASAPDRLVAMAARQKWGADGLRPSPAASPAAKQKEVAMTDKEKDKAGGTTPTSHNENDGAALEGGVTMTAADMTRAAEAASAAAVKAERERSAAIMAAVRKAGLDPDAATAMIAEGLSVDQARAKIIDMWADASGSRESGYAPRPTPRILRDERETMRAGMSAALVARINRAAPEDDRAKPFMAKGIVEMAAEAVGHDGSLIRYADRERVMMAAFHTTSDFVGIFENALNKGLLERYQRQEPTYRMLARQRNFNDFRPHPMVRTGDFPQLQPVGQAGEIKWGTFGDNREVAVLSAYGIGMSLSREMIVNDDLNAIDQVLSDQGASIAHFEEAKFYAFFDAAGTLLSDGKRVFHADHGNLASAGAAISVTTLAAGRAAMRAQTTLGGQKINVAPRYLVVPPQHETLAEQHVAPISAESAGNFNPFVGKLQVVTTAHLTANPWYLFADPATPGAACFVYGYLNGAEAPRVRMEEPFGRQGMSLTLEHDFGLGASDYRGGWKNPQA